MRRQRCEARVEAVVAPSKADGIVWLDPRELADVAIGDHKLGLPAAARVRRASGDEARAQGAPWLAVRLRRKGDLERASRLVRSTSSTQNNDSQETSGLVVSEWVASLLGEAFRVELDVGDCGVDKDELPMATEIEIRVASSLEAPDLRFGAVVIRGCLVCVDAFGKQPGLVTSIRVHGEDDESSIARVGPRTQVFCHVSSSADLKLDLEGAEIPRQLQPAATWIHSIVDELGPHVQDAARIVVQRMCRTAQRLEAVVKEAECCYGRGFLITGPSGVGKSLFAGTLARAGGADVRVLRPTDYFRTAKGEGEAALMSTLAAASSQDNGARVPCVVIVDQIDLFDLESDLGRVLVSSLDRVLSRHNRLVFIVALTDAPARISPALRSSRRLGTLVELRAPLGRAERTALASRVLRKALSTDPPPALLEALARRANGRLPSEIDAAARELALSARMLQNERTTLTKQGDETLAQVDADAEVAKALHKVGASSLRDSTVLTDGQDVEQAGQEDEINGNSKRAWDVAVGGLEEAKQRLETAILLPLRSPEAMAALGLRQGPRGILLHGPSGNGKTLLARSLAGLLDQEGLANFISVSCPDLVSKVVGASEAAIGALFRRAAAAAPCIVFMDQIDALAPARGNDSTSEQSMDRMLSMLLTEMDGIHSKSSGVAERPIVVLAATDRRDTLDPAILRPGRFDEHIFVGPPKSERDRIAIARVALRDTPFRSETSRASFITALLAKQESSLSAAHLCAQAHGAVVEALRRDPTLSCMPDR
ncbi:26S proteasome regulatory subunit 8-like [Hondaea fermentalgiana]|uniref:26S proteasome regulatory subunit 8-like n=1 Tax=Hondaea fermentalgiana TaxID=2315210 RepID=A0A2R5GHE8_9STRA|nr:26S proteasome regulatory subunit 8-like [Hondaea fermentalgiana]|eukprot:GBG27711.1 26S proteasome regulatory subunit 8-like [Hondaea fermentalgiana]